MPVVSVFISKGGTGKTATSMMLATNPNLPFKERLLVDLDPQGLMQSRKFASLPPVPQGWRGTTDLLLQLSQGDKAVGVKDVLAKVGDGAYFLRADRHLGFLEKLWPKRMAVRQAEQALKALLTSLGAYDEETLTVLDCPPGSSYSFLPRMALLASDYVLLPVCPSPLALDGLVASLEDLRLVREGNSITGEPPLNPSLKILGVLRTRVVKKDGVAKAALKRLPSLVQALGSFAGEPIRLLETHIRERVSVPRSDLCGSSVFQGAPCDALEDAKALGAEVSRLLGKSTKE